MTEKGPEFSQPQPQPYPPPYPQPYPQAQQQQQQQQVVIINNQPVNNRGQPQNIREWSSGVCGCFEDCNSCCYAYWCHQCFLCTLATKMNECYCGPHCCGTTALTACTCAPAAPNVFLIAMRSKLRGQLGIRGSICEDICCLWCCEFCAVTQMYRELTHIGWQTDDSRWWTDGPSDGRASAAIPFTYGLAIERITTLLKILI